jgi:hypothetical protein
MVVLDMAPSEQLANARVRVRVSLRQPARAQPSGFTTRSVDGGYFSSIAGGRRGRRTNSPWQFGQIPCSSVSTQVAQNVHSNVQMRASSESGGRSRSQHSQFGLSFNIRAPSSTSQD